MYVQVWKEICSLEVIEAYLAVFCKSDKSISNFELIKYSSV